MPSSRSLAIRSFSSIQAFFSVRYLSLICSSLYPLCLSTVCATKFHDTRRAPMAAESVSRRIAQILYKPPSQVLAPLGQLLVLPEKLLIPLGHLPVLLNQQIDFFDDFIVVPGGCFRPG